MKQWRKGIADWQCGDTLYLSVPFTWLMPQAENMAKRHKGPVVAGGPAVKLMGADWAETPDECPFDTLAMHNPCATYTTRGCPNACPYCAVPRIEGEFRELKTWKPAPVICDNNLLAASKAHFERVIESLRPFPYVDFNQGLEARRFTTWHADQIARLSRAKVRFSFDHANAETAAADAVQTARKAGLRDFGVYVLIGWNDTPAEARYRLEKVREWKIKPGPMRYQPLDCLRKNDYVPPGWTAYELARMARYYSCLAYVGGIPYEEFSVREYPLFQEAK